MLTHIAIDQGGRYYPLFSNYPRKELMEKLGRKHANKMYVDSKKGISYHIGYVIAGKWLTIWKTKQMRKVR